MGSQIILFQVEGITCIDCATKFEKSVKKLSCITRAELNIATRTLTVEGLPDMETLEAVREQGRKYHLTLSMLELILT